MASASNGGDGEYVLVRKAKASPESHEKSDTKDVKAVVLKSLASVPPAAFKAVMMASRILKKGKNRGNTLTVNAKLASLSTFNSGANATQFPVVTITVSGYTDYASFAAVYDEYRVKSFTFHISMTPSAAVLTPGRIWGAAFDSGNAAAYSIVYDVITAQRSAGPFACGPLNAAPQQVTATGFHAFSSGKLLPLLTAGAGTLAPLLGGAWIATSDNSAVQGYLKFGVDALGAAITSNVSVTTIAHVEFRMRT